MFFSTFVNLEAKNIEIDEIECSILLSDTPCADEWTKDVDCLMENYCATFEQAVELADRAFEKCLDETYGE